jgi:hypothetical protein
VTRNKKEIAMPTLPSGRRVEFSLDRFHALLANMGAAEAQEIADNLDGPDDLLFVLDAVHFSLTDGSPFFAGYVAADWRSYGAEWDQTDRDAFAAWLVSPEARASRAEAIRYIKALLGGRAQMPFPYALAQDNHWLAMPPGSLLRQ